MRLTRDNPALRAWPLWLAAAAVAEIGWFALLRPRLSSPFHTLFVLALPPLAVVGYVYLMVAVSAFLSDRNWDYRFRQAIVLILGFSVGCFVFALLWLAKAHFEFEIAGSV
jgi:hypothetical protein